MMADRRRIVPDTSVLVDALLPQGRGSRFGRAQQFLAGVLNRQVICFAPDALILEFIKVAFDFRAGRRKHSATADEIDAQVESFLAMPIRYVPSVELASAAIGHCRDDSIPVTDSWFLAAAKAPSAELWISHAHADDFTVNAAKAYGPVFTLAENDFYKAARRHGE